MSITIGSSSLVSQLVNNINKIDTKMSSLSTSIATGYRINKASDDPSGVVVMSSLNSSLVSINAAIENNQRSQSVLDTADSALEEVGNITAEIERLAAAAADPNCTASEKAAYQASIDGMLDSIDSIITTAEFNGTDLFTGVTAGTSGNAIKAADSGNGNITDIAVYSRDNSMTADKTMVVNATNTAAVTVDGNAATCEIIKKDDGTDSNFARIHYTNGDYSLSFTIDTTGAAADDEITITNGGGAVFQLGSDTDTRKVLDMGAGITTSELGSGVLNAAGDGWAGKLSSLRSGGTNSLTATNTRAAEIAKAASQQVAISRARVGNFNNYQIGSSLNTLQAAKEGMMDAYDNVAKTDYTEASSELDSQQILMNAAISVLSIANSQQNYALSLLQ